MVADNKILVLGGLMDDTVIESESKLPGFGDLPVLGKIFTYKTQKTEKRNLLIFIRPTILTDQIIADSVSAQKYKYIRAQQLLKEINSESNNQVDQTSIDSSDPELPQWMNYE